MLIQSRITEERALRERDNFRRAVGDAGELGFLSALDESLAWTTPDQLLQQYDGVMFGGSSDLDFNGGRSEDDPIRIISSLLLTRATDLILYALKEDFPTLGVCFGHQLIGSIRGGAVTNDTEQNKIGAHEVSLTEEGKKDALFSAMPENFFAQYAHKDSVTVLPEGATLLATGTMCRFSALRYGARVYTVQFHPEVIKMPRGPEHDTSEASGLVQHWIRRVVGKG